MFLQGPNLNYMYNFQEQSEDVLQKPKEYFLEYFQGPVGF